MQQEKNLKSRTQLDEPLECTSGSDPLLLYKILHLLFFPLLRILCSLCLESRKNYQHGLDVGPLEFQFLWPRECLTKPFRTLSLCFGVISKTPGLISHNNFVKKFLSASAIVIMSWQDVTHSSLCSGVKECGTKRAHNFLFFQILFQNLKNYSPGDVQRFCCHSLCDSTVIFNQISNSNNVHLSSSQFWTATILSLFIFCRLPSILKLSIPPKNF